MKRFVSLFLALIIALSCLSVSAFAAKEKKEIAAVVSTSEGSKTDISAVKWFKAENGEYYFFLSSAYKKAERVKLWFDGADVKVNGQPAENGAVIPTTDGILEADGVKYAYHFLFGSKIASVYITTESGSMKAIDSDPDHNVAEEGKIFITDEKGESVYDGGLKSIKGRGNASWQVAKKGYNIKLDDKTNLFKMGKSAKWCLIANHDDKALMRNALMYAVANEAGMAYTPLYVPVDVYFNNEYNGTYILTTKIEAAKQRINVENIDDYNEEAAIDFYDDEDFEMDNLKRCGTYGRFSGLLENTQMWVDVPEIKNEDYDVTGGYILELEIANRYYLERSGFVTGRSQPVIMKCPEYSSEEQIKYISDYYQRFEDAVFSDSGKNSKGEAYTDLADFDSFVDYYLISEWCANLDSGLTSTYMYKDKGGKLFAGPVWDYDKAFGNFADARFGIDYTDPNQFSVCFGRQYRNTVFGRRDVVSAPTLFNQLCRKQEFVSACKTVWKDKFAPIVAEWTSTEFDKYASKIEDSAVMNAIRWNLFKTCDVSEIKQAIAGEEAQLKSFASKKAAFMSANLGTVHTKEDTKSSFETFINKILGGINELFEKFLVTFHLENL